MIGLINPCKKSEVLICSSDASGGHENQLCGASAVKGKLQKAEAIQKDLRSVPRLNQAFLK